MDKTNVSLEIVGGFTFFAQWLGCLGDPKQS
jgi:hypothetical protein